MVIIFKLQASGKAARLLANLKESFIAAVVSLAKRLCSAHDESHDLQSGVQAHHLSSRLLCSVLIPGLSIPSKDTKGCILERKIRCRIRIVWDPTMTKADAA